MVRGADGRPLGQVIRCLERSFEFEKGFLFPDDCSAAYEEVVEVRDSELVLSTVRARCEAAAAPDDAPALEAAEEAE